MQAPVEVGKHFRGRARMLDGVFAKNANSQRGEESGGSALAGDVAKGPRQGAFAGGKKVVEFAAELTRRSVASAEIEPGNFARARGQEPELNLTSGVKVLLEAALVFAGLFEEAGGLQSHGDVGAESLEQGVAFGCERARLGALKGKGADEAVLEEKWEHQVGRHLEQM